MLLYTNYLKYGVNVTLDYDEKPLVIKGNVDELGQVWVNLITNAIDAMNDYGDLLIKIEEGVDDVVVAITDSGTGIEENVLEKIFEPFYTTKEKGKGTGLGLDIVKSFVTKQGGSISFDSALGVGTTVFVRLKKG